MAPLSAAATYGTEVKTSVVELTKERSLRRSVGGGVVALCLLGVALVGTLRQQAQLGSQLTSGSVDVVAKAAAGTCIGPGLTTGQVLCGNGEIRTDWTCGAARGGRVACPPEHPFLCAKMNSCGGGQDPCCQADCSNANGVGACPTKDAKAAAPTSTVTYNIGSCEQPGSGDKFYTSWNYSPFKHPQEKQQQEWCEGECNKWDDCHATMDFTGGRAIPASSTTTAGHGICHILFKASNDGAAAAKFQASPLKPSGACTNGQSGCWYFYPTVYTDATCSIKQLKITKPVQTCMTAGVGGSHANKQTDKGMCLWEDPGGVAGVQSPTKTNDNAGFWAGSSWNHEAKISPTVDTLVGKEYSVGTSLVVFTAVDGNGNKAHCSVDVIVVDGENPTAVCPASASFDVDNTCTATATFTAPTFKDNCGVDDKSLTGVTTTTLEFTAVEAKTLEWSAQDKAANSVGCKATFTSLDKLKPSLIMADITLALPSDAACRTGVTVLESGLAAAATKGAADNCATNPAITFSPSPKEFPVGTTVVSVTVKDPSNNFVEQKVAVEVTDETSPVIGGCPKDINVDADAGGSIAVKWAEPTVTDNQCGSSIARVYSLSDTLPQNGEKWRAGSYSVRYEAKDMSKNKAKCEFKVTVNDVHAPVFSNCPKQPSFTFGTAAGADTGLVSTPDIAATDTVDGSSVKITYTPFNINGYAIPVGIVAVTITALDQSGNKDTCEFIVEVTDKEVPWTESAECPAGSPQGVADGAQCGGQEVPVTARGIDGKLTLGAPKPFAVQSCCLTTSTCQQFGSSHTQDGSTTYSACKVATGTPTMAPTTTAPTTMAPTTAHFLATPTSMTWADAETYCKANSRHLLSIHSVEEHNAAMSFIQANGGTHYVFIGGKSDVISPSCNTVALCAKSYQWSDGTPWDFQDGDPINTGSGWVFSQQMRAYENRVMLYHGGGTRGDWGTLHSTPAGVTWKGKGVCGPVGRR